MYKYKNSGWAIIWLILSIIDFFEWIEKHFWVCNLILWLVAIPAVILYLIFPDWEYILFYYIFVIVFSLVLAIIKYSSIASKIEDDIERKLNGE